MPTVVDSLIVTLGLDPSGFKKGRETAEREQKQTQESVKKSAEAMGRSITTLAKQIAVLFVGFESTSGLINFLGKLNTAQASLSRMAQNLGISARALDVWDKKVELAGGSVSDAQGALKQLMHDSTALFSGETSPLLQFFQKLGVSTADTAFSADKAKDAYERLFDAMAQHPRAAMVQMGTQAGLSEGFLNYGLSSPDERAQMDKDAARASRTTDANAKAADNLRKRWLEVGWAIQDVGLAILEKVTPAVERLLPRVEKLALAFSDWLEGTSADKFTASIDRLTTSLEKLEDRLRTFSEYWDATWKTFGDIGTSLGGSLYESTHEQTPKAAISFLNPGAGGTSGEELWGMLGRWFRGLVGRAPYAATFDAASAKYKIPPGILEKIADIESGFDPNKHGALDERGLMQLRLKYHPDAGKDPKADIMEAAKTLAELYGQFHDWQRAAQAYNAGPGRISKAIAGQGTVPSSSVNYAEYVTGATSPLGAAQRYASSSVVNNNTVTTGDIIINTRATDGKQTAVDFAGELRKRDLVIQSNTGILP